MVGVESFLDYFLHNSGENWGGWMEILFWVGVLVLHGGLIAFAAWRLAVRHTDATGSSVLVPVKVKKEDEASASASSLLPSTAARRRGGSAAL